MTHNAQHQCDDSWDIKTAVQGAAHLDAAVVGAGEQAAVGDGKGAHSVRVPRQRLHPPQRLQAPHLWEYIAERVRSN